MRIEPTSLCHIHASEVLVKLHLPRREDFLAAANDQISERIMDFDSAVGRIGFSKGMWLGSSLCASHMYLALDSAHQRFKRTFTLDGGGRFRDEQFHFCTGFPHRLPREPCVFTLVGSRNIASKNSRGLVQCLQQSTCFC